MTNNNAHRPRVDAGDHLEPSAVLELRNVLLPAFGTPMAVSDLLSSLNRDFGRLHAMNAALPDGLKTAVHAASQQNWWRELLAAARQARPRDAALVAFADEFDLAPVPFETTESGTSRRIQPTWTPLAMRQTLCNVKSVKQCRRVPNPRDWNQARWTKI